MRKRRRNPAGPRSCCPEIAGLIDPGFFKALCDPNRIAILVRLARCDGPCTVSEVAACCPVNISVVSRHLALLRAAGILRAEKRGKEVHCSVRYTALVETLRTIADAIDACCPPRSRRKKETSP